MKKLLALLFTIAILTTSGFGQSSDNAFNSNDITWFGIDYTQCYFLTPIDFPNVSDLKSKLDSWNDLVLYEREKYIEKTLPGKNVEFEIDAVSERNTTIDVKSRLTEDKSKSNHLKTDQIQGIINEYNIESGLEGTALVLIAESYDKLGEHGNYYVTFFDLNTKKVYATERISGKAKGFGLRNYWAGSFYNVLKQVGKKY